MLKIDQQGQTIDITVRVAGFDVTYKTVVGQDTPQTIRGVPITINGEWDGATLVSRLRSEAQGQGGLLAVSRISVSADGNTLTQTQTRKTGKDDTISTIVFARKPATIWTKDPPLVLAEAVYKNIQIMKGVPAPKLMDAMVNLQRWLGVDCSYCHVPQHPDLDEKPAKQTARKMFLMVRALNHDQFPESNAVTCWTCHRGSPKPQSLPPQ